jgi:hypothetical protein
VLSFRVGSWPCQQTWYKLGWKVARDKYCSLFGIFLSYKERSFVNTAQICSKVKVKLVAKVITNNDAQRQGFVFTAPLHFIPN